VELIAKYDRDVLVKELNHNKDRILKNIGKENVDIYLFLMKEFKKGDILDNHVFQLVFRAFYQLDNPGFSKEQKKRFFKLLHQRQHNLDNIISDLYSIKKNIQFSFTTKLLHTIDTNKPIFDKYVGRSLKMGNVYGANQTRPKRIDLCLKKIDASYELLTSRTQELLSRKEVQIQKMIEDFHKMYPNERRISDMKVLDFILWTYGKSKK
jgi:hypothetical protein